MARAIEAMITVVKSTVVRSVIPDWFVDRFLLVIVIC